MRNLKLKSGRYGWRGRLREVYANFAEFESYSRIYGIAKRIGYKTTAGAWRVNPIIEGSTNPVDLRRVPKRKRPLTAH